MGVGAVVVLLLLGAVTEECVAQTARRATVPPAPAPVAHRDDPAAIAARRDDLAKVKEMLSDRDPLMRLANLEAIINSGDALRIQVALRFAFQTDDADLHALAMRAYVASHKQIQLNIHLPDPVQKQFDEAMADPEKYKLFFDQPGNQHYFVQQLATQGFKVQYRFSKYDVSNTTGTIQDTTYNGEDYLSVFTISGDRLTASVRNVGFDTCRVEVRPVGGMFTGSIGCAFFGRPSPRLEVSGAVF
jgi:hypothetical protein